MFLVRLWQTSQCPSISDLGSASAVMRRDLHTLTQSGMLVRDVGMCYFLKSPHVSSIYVETTLASTNVNGFPIVTSDGRQTLVGYIGRTELRYVIGDFLIQFQ